MKSKFYCLLILTSSFFTSMAQRTVTGHVTREGSTEAVQGVTVTIKGARTSTATNKEGNFSISVPANNAVLVFTSVGYKRTEVTVGSNTNLDVTIPEEATALNDVVVIGYQTVRRKDLTASVSSVSAKDLKDVPFTSAAEALNGRLAGVTANTAEGSPDASVRIRVRGGISITQNNDPLYIVDGVQVENALAVIAPQDIQTIDVLKDAAATAIYGARGANGVLVITTKTGKPGRTIVTYNGFAGVRKLAKELDVMTPYDYVIFQYERSKLSSANASSFAQSFGTTWDTLANYKDVPPIDWQDEVMGKTGIFTTHNVSASGGNNKMTYNFGYTFNYDKPVVINSNFVRHIVNLKADYKLTSKIKLGVGGRYTKQDVVGAGVSSVGVPGGEGASGTSYARLRNAVKYRPFFDDSLSIDAQDPLTINPGNGVALVNPIALSNAEYRKKSTDDYNVDATATFNLTKNLTFRSVIGYDVNNFWDRQFYDSVTSFSTNQGGGKPIVHLDTVYRKTLNNSNVLTYSLKRWKQKHDFDILLGEETYDVHTDSRSGQFSNFAKFTSHNDAISNTALGTVWTGFPVYNKSRYTNLSFFGRINYGFEDKYLLSLNMRYDGASKFAPGKQWGIFPGGSVAWRVKKEKFMDDVDWVSDLKFRYGYGKIGNNRIADYLFLSTYNYGTTLYALNNQLLPAYTQSALVNPDLQWESLVNRNYGMDVSLFRGRFDMSLDVYNNTSNKLLLNAKVAPTFGFTEQLQNVGATRNTGYEIQMNGIIFRNPKGFNWSANFNISHNKNTVLALSKGQTDYPVTPSWGISAQPPDYLVRIGYPVGSMYGWVTDGFYTVDQFNYNTATTQYTLKSGVPEMRVSGSYAVPGAIKFKDISGPNGVPDGIIDDNDKTIIGDATPKFTGGLNQQFSYKNWDASVFVNFSYGNDIFNANKIEFTSAYNQTSNLLDIMSNRWKTIDANGNVLETFGTVGGGSTVYAFGAAPNVLASANANATIWMPAGISNFGSGGGNFSYYPHSWAIEDGSFLRLNNVTIGYTLPVKSVTSIHLSKVRFYVTANNLAVWSNYSGYDPEVSVRSSGLTPGLDYSAYPKSHSFLVGVNATF